MVCWTNHKDLSSHYPLCVKLKQTSVHFSGLHTADDKEPDSNEPKEEKEKPEVQEEQKSKSILGYYMNHVA